MPTFTLLVFPSIVTEEEPTVRTPTIRASPWTKRLVPDAPTAPTVNVCVALVVPTPALERVWIPVALILHKSFCPGRLVSADPSPEKEFAVTIPEAFIVLNTEWPWVLIPGTVEVEANETEPSKLVAVITPVTLIPESLAVIIPAPTWSDGVVTIPALTLTPTVSTIIPAWKVLIPVESTCFTSSYVIVPATETFPVAWISPPTINA